MPKADYQIPAPADGSRKSWRKTITSVDPEQVKGYAIQGTFLDHGATYQLPVGVLVVGVDTLTTGHLVTIWHATEDGTLVELKTIIRKGPWAGPATIKAIAKLLSAHTATEVFHPHLVKHAANTQTGECDKCRQNVKAGDGIQGRNERGYQFTRHNECPPKPAIPNTYAGKCGCCGGWLDIGEGIVIPREDLVHYPLHDPTIAQARSIPELLRGGAVAIHPRGDCPPPDQRKPEPPRTNRYDEPCALCWQTVPAGTGLYRDRAVVHGGECPTLHDEPTWTISYGRPARFNPRPERGYQTGQTLRAKLWEHINPVPADAPGYRRDGHAVSAIVTVLTEAKPVYIRDEDGDSPADLIGEDGWFFQAKVRIATPDEAAAILAAEAVQAERQALRLNAQMSIVRAADTESPAESETGHVLRLPGVRVEPRASHSLAFSASWGAFIHLRVDHERGELWVLQYNGADGDNWSWNNCHQFIAKRMPLTDERRELVDRLTDEFGALS